MYKATIRLSTLENIIDFVSAISGLKMDIDLRSGNHEVDAKSIMGVCTLDLTKPIDLIAISDNEEHIGYLREILKAFPV